MLMPAVVVTMLRSGVRLRSCVRGCGRRVRCCVVHLGVRRATPDSCRSSSSECGKALSLCAFIRTNRMFACICDALFCQNAHRSSRLHFIGTWKARIEALMSEQGSRAAPQTSRPQPAAAAVTAGPNPVTRGSISEWCAAFAAVVQYQCGCVAEAVLKLSDQMVACGAFDDQCTTCK